MFVKNDDAKIFRKNLKHDFVKKGIVDITANTELRLRPKLVYLRHLVTIGSNLDSRTFQFLDL